MKILVVCQYYYPEPFRISDLCEEMVKRGHDVTVVTGTPNYPMGRIYPGYTDGRKKDEILNGVLIHRCPLVARRSGIIYRLLNYFSFVFSSRHYIQKIKNDFDVVYVHQLSPVMMASAGIKFKKRHRKRMVLYCLDLWPESLTAREIKKESFVYRVFHKVSGAIYKQADELLITSKSFADYFQFKFGLTDTTYLPQYAETIYSPEQCQKSCNDYFDLMFAGNIGAAQSVQTIIEAAKILQNENNIRWHIVGDGSKLVEIQKLANGLDNIFFYGRHELEEMPKYFSLADVMIVTMEDDDVCDKTLPGKVQSYMAAGKPIIGAANGETYFVINDAHCGLCGTAENAEALADNVLRMKKMDLTLLGNNAKTYYEGHFSKDSFFDQFENILLLNCGESVCTQ